MHPFTYASITKEGDAIQTNSAHEAAFRADHTRFLAGGTNLIDEMKLGIDLPGRLIDINSLPLTEIEKLPNGGVKIGAMVRNSDLAWDKTIKANYPVLSEALLSGASAQLRNMATTGGNLLQHTRCYYYRDGISPCNKREPGSGCAAIGGYNRNCAVLGTSESCIATHPSDMCVAMAALGAIIHVIGPAGNRTLSFDDFYIAYGDNPAKENNLSTGELITHVELPAMPWAKRSTYLKVRDRASYEFALSSAAVVLDLDESQKRIARVEINIGVLAPPSQIELRPVIRQARIALGGVAAKPWRSYEAEKALVGQPATAETFEKAAEAAMAGAKPQKYNSFKIELARRTIVTALNTALGMA